MSVRRNSLSAFWFLRESVKSAKLENGQTCQNSDFTDFPILRISDFRRGEVDNLGSSEIRKFGRIGILAISPIVPILPIS